MRICPPFPVLNIIFATNNFSISITLLCIIHSFDLQLEEFGVNIAEFTNPIQRPVLRAWLEDWEKPLLNNNDPVAEARLRVKYQGFVFFDPDNQTIYSVYPGNLEYHKGQNGGWCVIRVCADDVYDHHW